MDIAEIRRHWTGASEGHRKLKFDEAKSHMLFLLSEVERLHSVERENDFLKRQIENEQLMSKNKALDFAADAQRLITKHFG